MCWTGFLVSRMINLKEPCIISIAGALPVAFFGLWKMEENES